MKKLLFLCLALCASFVVSAQDVPYSKYLNYGEEEFKASKFKYHKKTNTWSLSKVSGLNTTINILSIIADAYEEVRPDYDDYTIIVQMGMYDQPSSVRVIYYNDETYRKILTFMKKYCKDIMDISTGKVLKHQAEHGDYFLTLSMEINQISRTSAHTADYKTVKNVDESYNEYEFVIETDIEPWSKYLQKQAEKRAKRDEKGKKKLTVDELM